VVRRLTDDDSQRDGSSYPDRALSSPPASAGGLPIFCPIFLCNVGESDSDEPRGVLRPERARRMAGFLLAAQRKQRPLPYVERHAGLAQLRDDGRFVPQPLHPTTRDRSPARAPDRALSLVADLGRGVDGL
jgi:hypothetical protein